MNRKKTIILSALILTFIAGSSFTITYLVDQNNQKETPIYIYDSGAISIINDINKFKVSSFFFFFYSRFIIGGQP